MSRNSKINELIPEAYRTGSATASMNVPFGYLEYAKEVALDAGFSNISEFMKYALVSICPAPDSDVEDKEIYTQNLIDDLRKARKGFAPLIIHEQTPKALSQKGTKTERISVSKSNESGSEVDNSSDNSQNTVLNDPVPVRTPKQRELTQYEIDFADVRYYALDPDSMQPRFAHIWNDGRKVKFSISTDEDNRNPIVAHEWNWADVNNHTDDDFIRQFAGGFHYLNQDLFDSLEITKEQVLAAALALLPYYTTNTPNTIIPAVIKAEKEKTQKLRFKTE